VNRKLACAASPSLVGFGESFLTIAIITKNRREAVCYDNKQKNFLPAASSACSSLQCVSVGFVHMRNCATSCRFLLYR